MCVVYACMYVIRTVLPGRELVIWWYAFQPSNFYRVRVHCILAIQYLYALVNQIPHYPPPRQMRGFDKGIDKRHFPQGRAFDMTP